MKTEWDYTALAEAYLKRPDYSDDAIAELVELTGVQAGDRAVDVGAGVAHLTVKLAGAGLQVTAIEPNDAMRAGGQARTASLGAVEWVEATAEDTGQPDHCFALATFGSSFNVTDRPRALAECARILVPRGWFACMWNHRDLQDPLQKEIEAIIFDRVPGYSYGSRRQDQKPIIEASGLFEAVQRIEGDVVHRQATRDWIEAWRSHATLQRQAQDAFDKIVDEIETRVMASAGDTIDIPYRTRIWAARLRA